MTQSHSLLEGRQIRVAGGRARVVDEGQVLLDVSVRPVGEEQVQQSLVAAIEAALLHGKVQQLGIGVHVGRVHEHARVEAVWPADVGRRGQLFTLKQLIGVLQHLLFVNCKGLDAIFYPGTQVCSFHSPRCQRPGTHTFRTERVASSATW